MAYGTVKVDNITFDNGGSDQNVTTSGIYRALTSGITVTGTISGAVVIGSTSVSGTTVAGVTVTGTTVQGVSGTFTSLTGTTTTGTTANFTSGVFTTQISGATVTGTTAQFTSGTFVSVTGTTITGTTINGGTVNATTGNFTSLTGTTITGTTINGGTVASTTGTFTSLTGTTTAGTTANFSSGVFTTQVSGVTVTGTVSNFTSGNFVSLSGATATFTSGVIASGTAAAPSLSIVGDGNTGIYSPGADQLAVATNGVQNLLVDGSGNVNVVRGILTLGATGGEGGQLSLSNPTNTANVYTFDALSATEARLFTTGNNTDLSIGQIVGTGGTVRFSTSATERLRITSAGLVGIGTSNPGALLNLQGTFGTSLTTGLRIDGLGSTTNNVSPIAFYIQSSNWGTQHAANIACGTLTGLDGGGYLRFSTSPDGNTAPAERLRITATGLVGIGTTSPSYSLDIVGDQRITNNAGSTLIVNRTSNPGSISWQHSGTETGQIAAVSGGGLNFYTGSTPTLKATLDNSGRLLVGTSTSNITFGAAVEIAGSGAGSTQLISRFNADANGPYLYFAKSRSGTIGTSTIVQSGDELGNITFNGANGSIYDRAAQISAFVDGTPGSSNDMPGRLVFSTTADGASSPTERMRIGQNGQVSIGVNSVGAFARASLLASTTSGSHYGVHVNSTSTADGAVLVEFTAVTTEVGNITTNGTSSVSYNTSSDYRLKENVTTVIDGITRLQQLKPSRFNFIADPSKTVDGFLAHEAAEVVPECVTGTKDEVDADGNPVYQGIDQSKLVPLLTAALQEAVARIQQLEAAVTALQQS